METWEGRGPPLPKSIVSSSSERPTSSSKSCPGGWLVYATCSLLPEENQAQAEAFLADHPQFRRVPVGDYLSADQMTIAGLNSDGDLRLSPARNGTDGVYAVVFERSAAR